MQAPVSEYLKRCLSHLFAEEMAFSPDMKNRQRVLQAIRRHPGLAFRDISRNSNLLKRQLDAVLETLKAENLIDIRDKGYWPVEESVTVGKALTDT